MTRISFVLSVLFLLAVQPSCTESQLIQDPYTSAIVVQILLVDGRTPDPGKEVLVLSTGESKMTNESGLARFLVPTGQSIVRVFGLNHGGPSRASEDHVVKEPYASFSKAVASGTTWGDALRNTPVRYGIERGSLLKAFS